jgi:membrane protein
VSSSAMVFIATQLTQITQRIALLGAFSPLILILVKALPYCVILLLFTFLYLYMPNTKVRFLSGLLGGIVAGTLYTIVQWVYITFQVWASRYGAIYGSFAALPLFLIWLHTSWLIVLFGTEISFAFQDVDTYEFEQDSLHISPFFKKLLALRIAHACVQNFCKGERPWTANRISHEFAIPIRLVNRILLDLVQCHVLTEVCETEDGQPAYQPGRDVETLSIGSILRDMDRLGSDLIPVTPSEELNKISGCMQAFSLMIEKSPENLLLKHL